MERISTVPEKEGIERGIYRSAIDGLAVAFRLYVPKEPKGVVQIVHGAGEYSGYYRDFCELLLRRGYAVLVSDIRGHGDSVSEKHPAGYIASIDAAVSDQIAFLIYLNERFSGKSVTLFGHSFGSLLARNVLMECDERFDRLVMTGVVGSPPFRKLGLIAGRVESFYTGKKRKGRMIHAMNEKMNLAGYSEVFRDALRRDPKMLRGYLNGGAVAIWESAARLKDKRRYRLRRPELPILLLNGTRDPFTGGAEGILDTKKTFEKMGYLNFESLIFEGRKHDLLHEDGREEVAERIVAFIEGRRR